MAETGVLVAVTGAWEAPLVAALEGSRSLVVLRRCADLAELLAAASTGRAAAALVSADTYRLDRAAVAQLEAAGVAVVGLAAPAALREQEPRLRALGVAALAPADAPVGRLEQLVAEAVDARTAAAAASVVDGVRRAEDGGTPDEPGPGGRRPATGLADPAAALAAPGHRVAADDLLGDGPGSLEHSLLAPRPSPGEGPPGRLVAVWGPPGAPGRTTVASGLAAELAAAGQQVLLVDADTHAASLAQVLGVLDEAPGLAAACRAAGSGALDVRALRRLAVEVCPRLRLLSGISRASRWPEVSPATLETVWDVARADAAWVVVDLAAPLESDEELSYDTAAPRRNGAALLTLEAADEVVVVGAADAIGLQRLVRGLAELAEAVPAASRPRVVVTRARTSSVGSPPERRVRDALARFAGSREVVVVPDDRPALDAALLAGRTLVEAAPRSPARAALRDLAATLVSASGASAASVAAPTRRRGALTRALRRRTG
ncbi:AAA family ATPase [Pseudokineococcus sp. 1T1Z-3]|uniref:AAA family ATPase n=1 Tax=Pseudokineococcus sp. 1T1Z-3 TaxID=3132745 RepID=UPI0030A09D09